MLVADFQKLDDVEAQLTGYDGCFYCAGVSSVGMSEAAYTVISYDTPLAFATTLARLNPQLVLTHVTGAHTDEHGKRMWARVKGRAESALAKLPMKGVYNFRPGLMTPKRGQKHLKTAYKIALVFAPLLKLFFPALTLSQVGRAMLACVRSGASKHVLEIPDIAELAGAGDAGDAGDTFRDVADAVGVPVRDRHPPAVTHGPPRRRRITVPTWAAAIRAARDRRPGTPRYRGR